MVSDIIHLDGLAGFADVSGPRQCVEDQSPVLDGLVAGFQIWREEGGGLPAVTEQQELAALTGLVRLQLVGGGGKRLVQGGGDDGSSGIATSLELATTMVVELPS